ncbi:phosphatase PAP2 family protein [Paenibacillus sp. BSR1-1]|uniref:phosphatase PAP2 family protein n=1 Tax=Paenibacillus sp. BSR1-1 TaxID=3020845 RepID=UPI0025B072A1|nr:phosphatase PAP2 family protein [Paenibacillus sp. BSR1-1]MDN3016220.1 phosphatase PAP2 family protein [Paenibacillus sp. BSR1-1]
MNLKKELFIAFLISFVSLLGFTIMALLVSKHTIITFDKIIIYYVQGFEAPWLTNIMKVFTFIGGTIPAAVISLLSILILYKVFNHRSELVLFIAVLLGANILFLTLKQLFHRARPDLHRLAEASNYSFPSGHATMAFALYGVLTFLLWRHISTRLGRTILIIFSVFMIVVIGISRIYLGVHYPSDIIAGYFISAFWLTFAIGFYQRYKERQYQQKQAK